MCARLGCGILGWPVGAVVKYSLGVALQMPGSGRQGAAERECNGAGWEEGEGPASGTAGVWQQWPHAGGLADARRGLQARPAEAAVRKLAKVGHSPMSFGTGSESGLDRGAFWRFGTLRQHSLGWQGAGAWPRGGCQGCDGDVRLEPWGPGRGGAESSRAASGPGGMGAGAAGREGGGGVGGWGGGPARGPAPQARRIFISVRLSE